MKEIGMTEGFDVGMEMSGAAAGFRDMVENMKHGGKNRSSRTSETGCYNQLGNSNLEWS